MKPETRRAFNAARLAHGRVADGTTEAEATFIAGMMEAARLCRGRIGLSGFGDAAALNGEAKQCADTIESSVKGE